MKAFKILMGIINAVCLTVFCLTMALELPAFDLGFYSREYDRYNIPQSIGVDKDELMRVTDHMLKYLKDQKEDLVVHADVNGVSREFFNDLEKSHMVDVKNLFLAGYSVRTMSVYGFLGTILLLYLFRQNPWTVVARANRAFSVFITVALMILAGIIMMNFDRAFTMFHLIFFDNDLWILNPQTDLLINIVPLQFFMDISRTVALIFLGFMALIVVVSTVYLRHKEKCDLSSDVKWETD